MFENFSREQALRIASFIALGLTLFGVDLGKYGVDEGSLGEFIFQGVLILGMVIDLIGYLIRYTKGDVTLGARRKARIY